MTDTGLLSWYRLLHCLWLLELFSFPLRLFKKESNHFPTGSSLEESGVTQRDRSIFKMAKKPSHANLIKIYHHHPISHCESLRFTFKLSSILDRCSFSSLMCLLPCHHYLNTTSKSIISSRCFQWKSEHHLMKGRENPPRSEIKLKLFDNQLDSSKNAYYVIIYDVIYDIYVTELMHI